MLKKNITEKLICTKMGKLKIKYLIPYGLNVLIIQTLQCNVNHPSSKQMCLSQLDCAKRENFVLSVTSPLQTALMQRGIG